MDCFEHRGTAAVGVCAGCNRALCRRCIGKEAPRLLCATCSEKGTTIGYEYKSNAQFGNWPLVHIVKGIDAATGRKKVARGVIAMGDIAIGVVALGGISIGLISLGGISIGLLLSIGGIAAGLGFSFGGLAVGAVGYGGLAIGFKYAIGGSAIGPAVIDAERCDPAALEFFHRFFFNSQMLPPSCR